jgi:hypothetical protein
LSKLGKCEAAILRQVIFAYPNAISLREAAEAEGYSTASSGPGNAAGKLRTLNLVEGGNAAMRANKQLL